MFIIIIVYNNKHIISRNCASSWLFTQSRARMHGRQNIKNLVMNSCLTIYVHNWSSILFSVSSRFPRNTFGNQWFHTVYLKLFKSISDRIVPSQFPFSTAVFKLHEYLMSLGFCDRASWANCEERENQQDATIRCFLSTSVSTCFGHHYAHLQENKDRVCSARTLQRSAPQPLPTTSSRTSAAHHMQWHTVFVLLKMGIMMPETCWDRCW